MLPQKALSCTNTSHPSNPKEVPRWSCSQQTQCPRTAATQRASPCLRVCRASAGEKSNQQIPGVSPSLLTYHHFLLEAPEHLLQLQLVLAVELGLVPVLLLLKETQLPQFLAPAEG